MLTTSNKSSKWCEEELIHIEFFFQVRFKMVLSICRKKKPEFFRQNFIQNGLASKNESDLNETLVEVKIFKYTIIC